MGQTLGQALIEACRGADGVALCDAASQIGYAQLASLAAEVAELLGRAGLQTNEPVHVQVSNQPLDIVAMLGVWLAGGVVVAIHRSTPQAVVSALQQRTGARYAIDLRSPRVDDSALHRFSVDAPAPRPLLDKAALVIFTSGSTGIPKGVVLRHDAFLGKIRQIQSLLGFGAADRVLLVLNLSFGFGLWLSLLTLLRGGTLILAPSFDAAAFLDTLAQERITRVGMVPTMMRLVFADTAHAAAIDRVVQQGSLQQMLIGGETLVLSLARTIRERFPNTELIDIYGLTETSTCDFFAFPADAASSPGCIGRPSPQVRHRIVDAAGQAVAAGALGELQIQSPFLMSGYLDAPALTAAALHDGWLKTGDLAREVAGGLVELMGRHKEVISRGGNKVTPVEIEQCLCAHPDVAAAMAVGLADALLGERIHVLVVPRAGVGVEIAALRAFAESRLEKFKRPDAYYVADALPLGRTGKSDRGQLKGLIEAGQLLPKTR